MFEHPALPAHPTKFIFDMLKIIKEIYGVRPWVVNVADGINVTWLILGPIGLLLVKCRANPVC